MTGSEAPPDRPSSPPEHADGGGVNRKRHGQTIGNGGAQSQRLSDAGRRPTLVRLQLRKPRETAGLQSNGG